jgi:hypothetical protein
VPSGASEQDLAAGAITTVQLFATALGAAAAGMVATLEVSPNPAAQPGPRDPLVHAPDDPGPPGAEGAAARAGPELAVVVPLTVPTAFTFPDNREINREFE